MRPEMGAGWGSHRRSRRSGSLRQTNPICPGTAGRGNGGRSRDCYPRWGQTCETKPISPKRCQGISTVSEKSYNELDLPRPWAKQSQFRHGQQAPSAGMAVSLVGRTSCTNKANWPWADRRGSRLPGLQRLPLFGTSVRNKANFWHRAGPMDPAPATVCRPHPLRSGLPFVFLQVGPTIWS